MCHAREPHTRSGFYYKHIACVASVCARAKKRDEGGEGRKINSVSSSPLPSSLLPFVLLSLQLFHNNSSVHSRLLRRRKNLWKMLKNTYTHRETGRHCSYEQSYWLSHKTRENCDGKKLCVTQSFAGLICHEIHYWTVDHREQNLPEEKKSKERWIRLLHKFSWRWKIW